MDKPRTEAQLQAEADERTRKRAAYEAERLVLRRQITREEYESAFPQGLATSGAQGDSPPLTAEMIEAAVYRHVAADTYPGIASQPWTNIQLANLSALGHYLTDKHPETLREVIGGGGDLVQAALRVLSEQAKEIRGWKLNHAWVGGGY